METSKNEIKTISLKEFEDLLKDGDFSTSAKFDMTFPHFHRAGETVYGLAEVQAVEEKSHIRIIYREEFKYIIGQPNSFIKGYHTPDSGLYILGVIVEEKPMKYRDLIAILPVWLRPCYTGIKWKEDIFAVAFSFNHDNDCIGGLLSEESLKAIRKNGLENFVTGAGFAIKHAFKLEGMPLVRTEEDIVIREDGLCFFKGNSPSFLNLKEQR